MKMEEKNKEITTPNNKDEKDLSDDEFLKKLEEMDNSSDNEDEETEEEKQKRLEEEQREFNKKKEEERKAKEAEEKAKKEQEQKEAELAKQKEEEAKKKAEEEKAKQEKQDDNRQNATKDVRAFREKYPDVDVNELAKDKDFMRLARREWGPDGSTLIEVYEYYTDFVSRVSGKGKEDVGKTFTKKSTPSPKSGGGASGGKGDIYSEDDVKRIAKKMPTMTPKEYDAVIDKYLRSVAFYSKK
jgi:chemotaxis protein histidine kinase CheA